MESRNLQDKAAGETEGPEIVSEFPKPPVFFTLYKDGPAGGPPPPKPMSPTYHMFGTPYSTKDVVPDLLGDVKPKLYKTEEDSQMNYKAELKKINLSLLANFMELVDLLIVNPTLFNEKLSDLETLFLNMHNVINSYRPHQARETLIEMLKLQIAERKEARKEFETCIEESKKEVKEAHEQLSNSIISDSLEEKEELEQEESKHRFTEDCMNMDMDIEMKDASAFLTGSLLSPRERNSDLDSSTSFFGMSSTSQNSFTKKPNGLFNQLQEVLDSNP